MQLDAQLQGLAHIRVSVNLSVHQLRQSDLVERVQDSLLRHAVDPDHLTFEITESAAMENPQASLRLFERLTAVGVHLSIDDFGTGYSSLAYLKQFSLDKLKIDRSFVQDLPGDAADAAIARTIVAVGHELRMVVAAEGVETQEQADFLREMGCDELQGYHFGRPSPADEIDRKFPRD